MCNRIGETSCPIRHTIVYITLISYLDNDNFPAPTGRDRSLCRTWCVNARMRTKVADFSMDSGCFWPCEKVKGVRRVCRVSEQQQVQLTRVCSYCRARWSEPSPAMALLLPPPPPPPPPLESFFARLASTLARLRWRHPRRYLEAYLLSLCDTLNSFVWAGCQCGRVLGGLC